jgi:hypothetical protein
MSQLLAISVVFLFLMRADGDEPRKPEPRLPIGNDTTVVTGPLDKDGFINYAAALNERLGKGVTPENNSNALLVRVFGPKPEGAPMPAEYYKMLGIAEPPADGGYFVGITQYVRDHLKLDQSNGEPVFEQQGRASKRPWAAKDFPQLDAWLKANEKPLALAREAVLRPNYYYPLVSKSKGPGAMIGALLSNAQKARELSAALTARAMLRTAEGKPDEAWKDLLACHRLGRLVGRGGTIIESLVGFAVDQTAGAADLAHLAHGKLTADQLRRRLKDLEGLPPLPPVADNFTLTERFMFLDALQMMLRGDAKDDADGRKALQSLDWRPVLRDANKLYDRLTAAARLPSRAERQREFQKIDEELKAIRKEVKDGPNERTDFSKMPAKQIGTVLIGLMLPALDKVRTSQDRATQAALNVRVACALAAYHADHGRYPAKLTELAPAYLAKVPDDVFAATPLTYKPTEHGFLLYSVGPNGKDDGGRTAEDEPKGDDIRIRMPLSALKE